MSERRKLRFGVRAEDGRRSRVWSVATVAHGGDVYLTPGGAASAFHFSLHSDDYWHMKMVHPSEPVPTDSLGPRMAPEEQIPIDAIPAPRPDGLTRAFLIAMSPGGLSASAEPPRGKVRWQPAPSSAGLWAHFNVFLAPPGAGSTVPGLTTVGTVLRGDGGAVVVTHHEAPLDTARLEVPVEMWEAQRDAIVRGEASAMLVLLNEDESWRVVEGPIIGGGPDGFDIACDEPWFPEDLMPDEPAA